MRDNGRDRTNWKELEHHFFNKVLKKEESGVLPKIEGLPETTDLPEKKFSRENKMSRADDRAVFDYQEAIFNASRSMIRFKKPRRLLKVINKIINGKVGVAHSAVLLYDGGRNSYVLADSRGAKGKKIPAGYVRLDPKSPIISFFSEKNNKFVSESGTVCFKDLKWMLENGQLLPKGAPFYNKMRLVLREMELFDAELCVPCFFKKELLGILILGRKVSGGSFSRREMNLFAALANDAAMAITNAKLIDSLQRKVDEVGYLYEREHNLFINTATALATAVDARDAYTHGHAGRVTRYCLAIAEELGNIPEVRANGRFKETLRIAALLHDIGKIGIPDSILNKKSRLSPAERAMVEKHTELGASILSPLPELSEISKIVRLHQEWYNGNGYPDGLKRDEIPIIARIVSVADTFDAITSDRPYRKRKSGAAALKEIKECAEIQFDPQIVDAFVRVYSKGKLNGA